MATMKIDQAASFALVIMMSAVEKLAFRDGRRTGEQDVNKDGIPKWAVQVSVADRETGTADLLKVTVTSRQNPLEIAQPGMPIHFEGLGIGVMNGNPYFVATGIASAMVNAGNGRKASE